MLFRFIPGIKFTLPPLARLHSIIFHAANYSFQVGLKMVHPRSSIILQMRAAN